MTVTLLTGCGPEFDAVHLPTIPGKEAYIDPAKSGCDLVK